MNLIIKISLLIWKKIKIEKELSFFVLFLFVLFLILKFLSPFYLINIPKNNTELHEIVIGEKPMFVNPVLATSRIDRTLINLFYKPLLDSKNKMGISDLVVSENQKEYYLNLRDNIYFHDGEKIIADDIIFTIQKIKDPRVNSKLNGYFSDIRVEKINEKSVKFILPVKNYYFRTVLQELAVIPKHVWEKIEYFLQSQENLGPIGYGDFQLRNLIWDEDQQDKKIKTIVLEKSPKVKSYIDLIYFHFFDNFEEYKKSDIYSDDSLIKTIFSGDKNKDLSENYIEYKINEDNDINFLIKNYNKNKFLKKIDIRKLLFEVWKVDQNNFSNEDFVGEKEGDGKKNEKLVKKVKKEGKQEKKDVLENNRKIEEKIGKAEIKEIEGGQKEKKFDSNSDNRKNDSVNNVETDQYARIKENIKKNKHFSYDKNGLLKYDDEIIIFTTVIGINQDRTFFDLGKKFKDKLKKIGITMQLKILQKKEFPDVVKARDFDSIIIGYDKNPIYWPYYYHSSQKNDPGLNIAQFDSRKIDKMLYDLTNSINPEEEKKNREKIKKEIETYYVILKLADEKSSYYSSKKIQDNNFDKVEGGVNRFDFVKDWVVSQEKVLPFFKDYNK